MVSNNHFSLLALSFPNTEAAPHFDRIAFKVVNKRIFATLHEESQTANLKFSPADQSVYSMIDEQAVYAVKNKWGQQGWTTFDLKKIDSQLALDSLEIAYNEAVRGSKKK